LPALRQARRAVPAIFDPLEGVLEGLLALGGTGAGAELTTWEVFYPLAATGDLLHHAALDWAKSTSSAGASVRGYRCPRTGARKS